VGATVESSINEALRDHPPSPLIDVACCVAWRMVTEHAAE
jgi:hypothetical protein